MSTKEREIDELLARSVASVLPSKEKLKELLLSGKRLRVYIGADATGPQLHLGHATNFMLLERFRRLGHETIVLFGDFTAMLGDPTGRSKERIALTKEQVESHIASWKSQVSKLIDFEDTENPAKILRNSEWLASMNLSDVIGLARHFTVQQMLERDMFEKRLQEEKPIYLNEFLYPLLQGYDSVAMDVDIEIGGNDQTFNMLAGRTLQKAINSRDKSVIATTLLEHPVTKKKLMSKSEGGYIALDDTPNDMFGKSMALPDEIISQMFVDCTELPMAEIAVITKTLASGGNPRDAKIRLAKEIVALYHGVEEAEKAETYFIGTFSKGALPDEALPVDAKIGEKLIDVIVRAGFAASNGEARRKIAQGGVAIDGTKIDDLQAVIEENHDQQVMKVGKKDFAKILLTR
jgi:tyrosyl-tRNA synthetase